jgi:hypothetical protein
MIMILNHAIFLISSYCRFGLWPDSVTPETMTYYYLTLHSSSGTDLMNQVRTFAHFSRL